MPQTQKIFLGVDYGGQDQAEELKSALVKYGEVVDVVGGDGSLDDYIKISQKVARLVQDYKGSYGVLMCGTGTGVSIVANKHKGVHAARCVVCHDAEDCKMVNNANVLCLSGKTSIEENIKIIDKFFTTNFHDKPSDKSYRDERYKAIGDLEETNFK